MSQYSKPIDIRTSSQLYETDSREKTNSNLKAIAIASATGFGLYKATTLYRDRYSLNRNTNLTFMNFAATLGEGGAASFGGNWQTLTGKSVLTGGDYLMELIRKAEEYSPGKVARTFQLTPLLTPFYSIRGTRMHFTPRDIEIQKNWIKPLLEKHGSTNYDEDIKRFGAVLQDGKLYKATAQGQADLSKVILEHAYLGHIGFKVPRYDHRTGNMATSIFDNRILRNYGNTFGGKINRRALDLPDHLPVVFFGGKTKASVRYEYGIRGYARTAMQRGAEVLDFPGGFLKEYFPEDAPIQRHLDRLRLNLGTKGQYNLGVRQTVLQMGKNIGTKVAFGALAYYGLDELVRKVAPENSYFNNGIVAGLASIYGSIRTKYAELVTDHTQGLKRKQENIAPGSTSLITLAGLPASFALAGAMGAYGKHLFDINRLGYEAATTIAHMHRPIIGTGIAGGTLKRWTIGGALAGLILEAPFIPGALLTGDSSEELKAEYSGKKEVPVYSNRWWMGGGGPWEGGKIKYFRPSMVHLLKESIEEKSIYGDHKTAASVNPALHPFDYLRDPYKKEKITNIDRPYPIWGMDVSTGSFLGKVFERTIGRIIKPDRFNPALLDLNKGEDFELDNRIKEFADKMQDPNTKAALQARIAQAEKENIADSGKLEESDLISSGLMMNNQNIQEVDLSKFEIKIDDADTLILKNKANKDAKDIEIRLSGIDAPEIGTHISDPISFIRINQEQLYGQEASKKMQELVEKQNSLRLVISESEKTYGRYVGALLGDDDTNLNVEAIKQGLVIALPWGNADIIPYEETGTLEEEAKQNKEGIWEYKRYQAVDIFNRLTGQRQTFNTLTRIDKLAERPELGMYTTFLENLAGQKGDLSEDEINKITKLAEIYSVPAKRFESLGFQKEDDGSYSYNTPVSEKDRSLIEEGLLLPLPNARNDVDIEAAKWSYEALKDFIGIKGFAIEQFEDLFGADLDTLGGVQLARSGEMSNAAREIVDLNLGGMLGFGEAQRRFIPTNAGAIPDTVNPLPNSMPTWLPHNTNNFYIDFSKGDPYAQIETGYSRLPGRGFEELNPNLKGMNPEYYPDIYKYKILTDVALGSNEYYQYKKRMERKYNSGALSESEQALYLRIKEQEDRRAQTKQFFEYKTSEEMSRLGTGTGPLARYWEFLTHGPLSEAPYEKLSIVRPSSKFIHQRTATEDYEATQLYNSDSAMWNKPIAHYGTPFFAQILRGIGVDYIPGSTEERREIDEYFDKLQYKKYRDLYKQSVASGDEIGTINNKRQYEKTIQGSLASGLSDNKEIMYSFIALPKREREYFAAFINADEEEREKIRELTPPNIGTLYEELWARKDILDRNYNEETGTIDSQAAQEQIAAQEQSEDEELANQNTEAYNNYINSSELQAQGSFREYLADIDAERYITETTGMPDHNFIGWDPRIDVKDIKLRALSIGGEDLYEYGFYKTDIEALKRVIGILNEQQITSRIDDIKKEKKNKKYLEEDLQAALRKNKLDPKLIELVQTNSDGQFTLNVEEQNGT